MHSLQTAFARNLSTLMFSLRKTDVNFYLRWYSIVKEGLSLKNLAGTCCIAFVMRALCTGSLYY